MVHDLSSIVMNYYSDIEDQIKAFNELYASRIIKAVGGCY